VAKNSTSNLPFLFNWKRCTKYKARVGSCISTSGACVIRDVERGHKSINHMTLIISGTYPFNRIFSCSNSTRTYYSCYL